MPQLKPIVLKDADAVDHTFNPDSIVGGVATVLESTGVPIGDRSLSYSISKTQSGRRKVNIQMVMPVVQDVTVNGVSKPAVVRTARAKVELDFDGSSSYQDRSNLRELVRNALANADIAAAIYTTSAFY